MLGIGFGVNAIGQHQCLVGDHAVLDLPIPSPSDTVVVTVNQPLLEVVAGIGQQNPAGVFATVTWVPLSNFK